MIAGLESLPWLVLSQICEHLDDEISRSCWGRRDIWAFSLTSRKCCAVAADRRFCEVQIEAATPKRTASCIAQWDDILSRDGGRYRHVRRLSIKPPRINEGGQVNSWDEEEHAPASWDMPLFCRPHFHGRQELSDTTLASFKRADTLWLDFARFTEKLPGLRDLIWSFNFMPRPILSAVHDSTRNCRLHMHHFMLESAVVPRSGDPPSIDLDADDYALATSLSLHAVMAPLRCYESDGRLNYNEEALEGMVASAAPNLRHLWTVSTHPEDSLRLRESRALRRPQPCPVGLFAPMSNAGSLQSLHLSGLVSPNIERWTARTDISKLQSVSSWNPGCVRPLADMAARGQLAQLKDIQLQDIDVPDIKQPLCRLLESLNPHSLRSLRLAGHIDNDVFDIIVNHQGNSLRDLSLEADECYSEGHDQGNLEPTPMVLTPPLAARFAGTCQNLESLHVHLDRAFGNADEYALYRALGQLPKLQRLSLRLQFTVQPDEHV